MKKRLQALEYLDLGPDYYTWEEYEDCLYQLGRIGKLLGGNRATLSTYNFEVESILDVGCGGGYFSAILAERYPPAKVVGIDLSKEAISYAKNHQKNKDNLSFEHRLEKGLTDPPNSFDVVTCTLVCHHMQDEEIVEFLRQSCIVAKKAVIINDLHRSYLAYFFFAVLAPLLFRNRLITHDGLLSIKRSFSRKDWERYLKEAGISKEHYSITWHPFFRWVIKVEAEWK